VLVEMSTVAQAARVAGLTGGTHLPGILAGRMSRRVDVGGDFETHRSQTESVSVLFKLFDQTDGVLAQVPWGWTITGASFEVEWPGDPTVVNSHFGARRFAYN